MPPTTIPALGIFLLFLPGFLAERVASLLTPKRGKTALESLINASGLSLLIYGFYQLPAHYSAVPDFPVAFNYVDDTVTLSFSGISFGILIALSLLVGVLVGWAVESGAFYRLLSQTLRLTTRTGRQTVWADVLLENPSPLVGVHLRNGTSIYGKCVYFSERPGENELHISPPGESIRQPNAKARRIMIDEGNGPEPQPKCQGILIPSSALIDYVEFFHEDPIDWGHVCRSRVAKL